MSSVGGFGASTGNAGSLFIALKDREDRDASADDIIARLRPKLAAVQGIQLFMQSVQDVRVGGRSARTQYQYTLEDLEPRRARRCGRLASSARWKKLKEVKDVNSDQQNQGLQLDVNIDHDSAARFGITPPRSITRCTTRSASFVATSFTEVNEYHVVLEAGNVGGGPEQLGQRLHEARRPAGAAAPRSRHSHRGRRRCPSTTKGSFRR